MILLDLGVAILLIVTIGFCVRLNQKIMDMQKSKGDLARLLKHFEAVISRAETGIQGLKVAGQDSNKHLVEAADSARKLMDDLTVITKQGSKTSDVLDAMLQKGKLLLDEANHMRDELQAMMRRGQSVMRQPDGRPPHTAANLPRPNMPATRAMAPENFGENRRPEPLRQSHDPHLKRVAIETLLERISAANNTGNLS
jgi:hypothetical protein